MTDSAPEHQNARLAVLIDADNTSASSAAAIARGARPLRHPDRQAGLRRLDDAAARRLEGRAASPRHPADPAVREHRGQELHRLRADHRRDGPALLRQPRRLRDRVQRLRLHPARDPAARVGQDRLRPRPATYADSRSQNACDRFIFLEVLARGEVEEPADATATPRRFPTSAGSSPRPSRSISQDDGWVMPCPPWAATSRRRTRRSTRATTASPSSVPWRGRRTTSRSDQSEGGTSLRVRLKAVDPGEGGRQDRGPAYREEDPEGSRQEGLTGWCP